MSWFSRCSWHRRSLRRLAAGRPVTSGGQVRLWNHLRGCAGCRVIYERAVFLERLMRSGGDTNAPPIPAEVLRFRDRVVTLTAKPKPSPKPLWSPVGGLAVAASLLLAVGVVTMVPRDEDEFRARSGTVPPLTIRLYCDTDDVSGRPMVRPLGEKADPAALSECPPEGTVLLSYQVIRAGTLTAFGQMSSGEVVGLTPPEGLPVVPHSQPVPLPFDLPVPSAPELVVVVLADKALAAKAVAQRRYEGSTWREVMAELAPKADWVVKPVRMRNNQRD